MEFEYDGGGLGKDGTVSLFVDGKKDGEGRIEMTIPMIFSGDETAVRSEESAPLPQQGTGARTRAFGRKVGGLALDLAETTFPRTVAGQQK